MANTSIHLPDDIVEKVRELVILPLKDAMRLKDYKEHERNYKFHIRQKVKGSKKDMVFKSYSFKLSGTLKHEMYLKPLNPELIKTILKNNYNYKLIIKPNRRINLDDDSKNKRSIELVVYFKRNKT